MYFNLQVAVQSLNERSKKKMQQKAGSVSKKSTRQENWRGIIWAYGLTQCKNVFRGVNQIIFAQKNYKKWG